MYSVAPNQRYFLIDHQVAQGTPHNPPVLEVVRVQEYWGQLIVFGIKHAHQQHIYIHGYEDIPAHPSCGVVLPHETAERAAEVTRMFRGRPISLRPWLILQDLEDVPIVNWARRLGNLWQPVDYWDPEERLRRAQVVIEVYLYWKRYGEWPRWFREARLGQRAALN